jgi:hypothetical protein
VAAAAGWQLANGLVETHWKVTSEVENKTILMGHQSLGIYFLNSCAQQWEFDMFVFSFI